MGTADKLLHVRGPHKVSAPPAVDPRRPSAYRSTGSGRQRRHPARLIKPGTPSDLLTTTRSSVRRTRAEHRHPAPAAPPRRGPDPATTLGRDQQSAEYLLQGGPHPSRGLCIAASFLVGVVWVKGRRSRRDAEGALDARHPGQHHYAAEPAAITSPPPAETTRTNHATEPRPATTPAAGPRRAESRPQRTPAGSEQVATPAAAAPPSTSYAMEYGVRQSRAVFPGRASMRSRASLAYFSVSASTLMGLTTWPATRFSRAQTKWGRSIRFMVAQ